MSHIAEKIIFLLVLCLFDWANANPTPFRGDINRGRYLNVPMNDYYDDSFYSEGPIYPERSVYSERPFFSERSAYPEAPVYSEGLHDQERYRNPFQFDSISNIFRPPPKLNRRNGFIKRYSNFKEFGNREARNYYDFPKQYARSALVENQDTVGGPVEEDVDSVGNRRGGDEMFTLSDMGENGHNCKKNVLLDMQLKLNTPRSKTFRDEGDFKQAGRGGSNCWRANGQWKCLTTFSDDCD